MELAISGFGDCVNCLAQHTWRPTAIILIWISSLLPTGGWANAIVGISGLLVVANLAATFLLQGRQPVKLCKKIARALHQCRWPAKVSHTILPV